MKVFIEAVDRSITRLIRNTCGKDALTDREVDIMDHCQLLSQQAWVGSYDGRFICAWGLVSPSILSDEAYLWLYTTPEIKRHQFLFVRHSQRIIEKMLENYSCITGHVKCGSRDSQRWLKWLGAEFGYPTNGSPLIPFRITKKWQTRSQLPR